MTSKVVPKNPGTCLKLRPKNPGPQNSRLFFSVRKLTIKKRKSKDSIISLCSGTMFVLRVLNFLQLLSVSFTTYKMLSKINIILPLWIIFILLRSSLHNLLVAVLCAVKLINYSDLTQYTLFI